MVAHLGGHEICCHAKCEEIDLQIESRQKKKIKIKLDIGAEIVVWTTKTKTPLSLACSPGGEGGTERKRTEESGRERKEGEYG